jgi:hypothetical protein
LYTCLFSQPLFDGGSNGNLYICSHLDHKIMEENLQYYIGMKEFKKESLVNLEQPVSFLFLLYFLSKLLKGIVWGLLMPYESFLIA